MIYDRPSICVYTAGSEIQYSVSPSFVAVSHFSKHCCLSRGLPSHLRPELAFIFLYPNYQRQSTPMVAILTSCSTNPFRKSRRSLHPFLEQFPRIIQPSSAYAVPGPQPSVPWRSYHSEDNRLVLIESTDMAHLDRPSISMCGYLGL